VDNLGVELQYYAVDSSSGLKTKIENALDFGNIFKGGEVKKSIAIYNAGDETAVTPSVSIAEFVQTGKNYKEALTWKTLSFDENSGYSTKLSLPDIKPKSWMTGKDIYMEDFSGYTTATGQRPDQAWTLWQGNEYVWQVYSGYLMHNTDTMPSRALWTVLPEALNCTISCKITVRNGVFAGFILRDAGDYDTGYIVLVQGLPQYLTPSNVPLNEGVIQVWQGKFSQGIDAWTLLYQSGSVGVRGTHDYFKIVLDDNKFLFYYGNESATIPNYSWVDENRTYMNASKPVLACHAGTGSILIYYDDIRMEVPTAEGRIWIKDTVNSETTVFGEQQTVFKVDFGGV
jgi:hypothetical protein